MCTHLFYDFFFCLIYTFSLFYGLINMAPRKKKFTNVELHKMLDELDSDELSACKYNTYTPKFSKVRFRLYLYLLMFLYFILLFQYLRLNLITYHQTVLKKVVMKVKKNLARHRRKRRRRYMKSGLNLQVTFSILFATRITKLRKSVSDFCQLQKKHQ